MKAMMSSLISLQFSVGPVIPYIPQLISLRSGKPSEGFSPSVSLVILVANILRMAFWVSKRFDIALLAQSVFLTIMQLALLQALVGNKVALAKKDGRELHKSFTKNFWGWDSFRLYLLATALLILSVTIASNFLNKFEWYVEGLGIAAVTFESFMGFPQLTRNYIRKSTVGISMTMVVGWVGGDFLKAGYYFLNGVPMVFLYGAAAQLVIDSIVAFQLFVLYPNEDIRALGRKIFGPIVENKHDRE